MQLYTRENGSKVDLFITSYLGGKKWWIVHVKIVDPLFLFFLICYMDLENLFRVELIKINIVKIGLMQL